MNCIRLIVLLMIAMVLSGCRTERTAETEPAARPAIALEQLRRELGPDALIGVVYAVHEQDNLAAVTEAPLDRFRVGDVLTFLDSRQEPIAGGTIVRITERALHVRYEEPDDGERAPQRGDFAVRIQ
jgi:hypothetical protein